MKSPMRSLRKKLGVKGLNKLDCIVENDFSNHSTFSVDNYNSNKRTRSVPSLPDLSGCRRVSFAKTHEATKVAANFGQSDVCWYSQDELVLFKRKVVATAKAYGRSAAPQDCNYRRVVTIIYNICRSCEFELQTPKDSILCPKDRSDLKNNVSSVTERLGLDRLTVPVFLEDVARRKKDMLQKVRDFQAYSAIVTEQEPGKLAQDLALMSRPSRLFARELGRAVASSCVADQPVLLEQPDVPSTPVAPCRRQHAASCSQLPDLMFL